MSRRPELQPERGWRNRPLERERDPQRDRWLWRFLLSMALALAPAAIYLVQHNLHVKSIYETNDARDRIEELDKIERQLLVQKERLEAEARIEAWARRQRNLHRPPEGDVVVVEIDETDPEELVARAPEAGSGMSDLN